MRYKLLGIIILVTVFVAGFWGVAQATQSFRSGNTATVGANETVSSTLWITGRTVDIAGSVNGDVFCAGQNVTVSGTIRGDLLCTAQNITITGTITGNVRAAGQTISLSGTVAQNLTVAAQSFSQSGKSSVQGDLSIGANDISLNGSTGRDAALAATTITLGGQVGRDMQATVGKLSLSSGARIARNLNYTSTNNAQLASGATVGGKTTKSVPKAPTESNGGTSLGFGGLAFALYLLAAALLVALVLVLLFPQAIHAIAARGLMSPWKALLVGLIAELVVPAVIIVLMLTVIGIPLGLILLATWFLVQTFAGVVSAYFLGRVIWRRQHNPIITMVIGAIVLLILYVIPFVGFIALIAALLLGTGMILLEFRNRSPRPRYDLKS